MSDTQRDLVRPDGRPARRRSKNCPNCGATEDKRVKSGGFGTPHDVCSICGFEAFEEDTE